MWRFVDLVVSGILDAGKLENAHRHLVELWPPIGGALVKSTSPYSFTSGSMVNFKARNLSQKLEDIPLVHFTATSSSRPTYHSINAPESDRFFHFDMMNKFPPPKTLFALRVTMLNDTTLPGFRPVHHLFDGQACYHAIKAYCNLVAGNPKSSSRP